MIERIPDHANRAVARLPEAQRGKVTIDALIRALVNPIQEVEDALIALLVIASIDSSEGAALDLLGRIVGQPRNGLFDSDYRTWIKARLLVNRSSGTIPEILAVLRAVFSPATEISATPEYPAGIRVRVRGVEIRNPDAVGALIKSSAGGGVRMIFDFITAPPAETFTLDDGPGLDDAHLADAASY